LTLEGAIKLLDRRIDQPNRRFVLATCKHWPIVRYLLSTPGSAGNVTTHAHIATIAIEHVFTVRSDATDFRRFPNIAWSNPGA